MFNKDLSKLNKQERPWALLVVYIAVCFLLLAFIPSTIAGIETLEAEEEPAILMPPIVEAPEDIYEKVDYYADLHNISRWLLHYIVEAESNYNPNAVGDGFMPSPSVGLVQISLHYHPDVTYEQAIDPDFALNWAGVKLAQGKCSLWTTCPNS